MTEFLHIITKLTSFAASRISDRQVSHLVQQIMRFLQLKYGSLMKAALGSSQDLNNVIGKLLYDTLFGRAMRPEMARDLEALIDQVPMLVRKSPFSITQASTHSSWLTKGYNNVCWIQNIRAAPD